MSPMEVFEGLAIVLALDALGLGDYSREASPGSGTPDKRDMDGVSEDRVYE